MHCPPLIQVPRPLNPRYLIDLRLAAASAIAQDPGRGLPSAVYGEVQPEPAAGCSAWQRPASLPSPAASRAVHEPQAGAQAVARCCGTLLWLSSTHKGVLLQ